MPRFSVLITDLDNTLFDWVDVWYRSFKAMLDQLVLDSGIPKETLIADFKSVHEKHGTAEYAFSIEELPSLLATFPGEDLTDKFDSAIAAFRAARASALRLYPTVSETLEQLKDKRCLVVGYTESMSFYSRYRVRKLGLDRILDYLYSPPDHELPAGFAREDIRRYPPEQYELRRTVHRHIPSGELKPNPKVLLDIIRDIGAIPSEAIYIGDSLMKDVTMARNAGVADVWAKYGIAQNREEYELLRKVTHWTSKDVEREKALKQEDIKPSCVLESNLGEVLERFEFQPFLDKSPRRARLAVDVWKKTVDVQQHFNDLELRIRNFALTVLAAILGLAAYAVKEQLRGTVGGHVFSVAAALLFSAEFPWLAFYFMDRFWYHRLLYGAVDQGRFIEKRWSTALPELSLTDSIGKYSPVKLPFGKWKIHTPRKIDIFYCVGIVFLLLLSFLASRTASISAPVESRTTDVHSQISSTPLPTNTNLTARATGSLDKNGRPAKH